MDQAGRGSVHGRPVCAGRGVRGGAGARADAANVVNSARRHVKRAA